MSRRRLHPADAAAVLAGGGMAVAAMWIAVAGPRRSLPVTWGWDGLANDFSTRGGVALTLGVMALVTVVIGLGLGLQARDAADPGTARSLRLSQLLAVVGPLTAALLFTSGSLLGVTDLSARGPLIALFGAGALALALFGRIVLAQWRAWQNSRERGSP